MTGSVDTILNISSPIDYVHRFVLKLWFHIE